MELHTFFFPFMAPGHTIPMLHTASLLSSLGAVKATVLTTSINSSLLSGNSFPYLHHLLLPFPIDSIPELTELTSPFLRSIVKSTDLLRSPVDDLISLHRPDCIVSDQLFPWTSDLAAKHGIARLSFLTSGLFPHCCTTNIVRHVQLHCKTLTTFTIPGLPHSIVMKLANLPDYLRCQAASELIMSRLEQSEQSSYGVIVNGFDEIEPGFTEYYKEAFGIKVWHALSDGIIAEGEASPALRWLDSQKPKSVVYMCFGSLGKHTPAQLREIGLGLETAGYPFLWVVKEGVVVAEGGKGVVVRGWVPQAAILNHVAVGGFVTHCGWNSVTEGVRAGVPMATWPLFAEQFFNERLVVDVLGVGVAVGAEGCSSKEEDRGVVAAEEVRAAVVELMGEGEVAVERRRRSREMGEKARAAASEGGSSYREMGGID